MLKHNFLVGGLDLNLEAIFIDFYEISVLSNIGDIDELNLEIMDPWWVNPETGLQDDIPSFHPLVFEGDDFLLFLLS